MKSGVLSFVSIIFFMSMVSYGAAEVPPLALDKKQTIDHGCKIKQLKKSGLNNCVLEMFDGHDLVLTIYDLSAPGKYLKSDQIKVTSWYNEAKVSYEDLTGRGTDFIVVEFEGNTGTGTLEKILAVFGWNKSRFVPVLIEPLTYYIDNKGLLTDLKIKYDVANSGSDRATFNFTYTFSKEFAENKHEQATWRDSLLWDEATFSFYKKQNIDAEMSSAHNPIQKKVLAARINTIKALPTITDVDLDLLRRLKIMDILE
jgi:hypothetical protein